MDGPSNDDMVCFRCRPDSEVVTMPWHMVKISPFLVSLISSAYAGLPVPGKPLPGKPRFTLDVDLSANEMRAWRAIHKPSYFGKDLIKKSAIPALGNAIKTLGAEPSVLAWLNRNPFEGNNAALDIIILAGSHIAVSKKPKKAGSSDETTGEAKAAAADAAAEVANAEPATADRKRKRGAKQHDLPEGMEGMVLLTTAHKLSTVPREGYIHVHERTIKRLRVELMKVIPSLLDGRIYGYVEALGNFIVRNHSVLGNKFNTWFWSIPNLPFTDMWRRKLQPTQNRKKVVVGDKDKEKGDEEQVAADEADEQEADEQTSDNDEDDDDYYDILSEEADPLVVSAHGVKDVLTGVMIRSEA